MILFHQGLCVLLMGKAQVQNVKVASHQPNSLQLMGPFLHKENWAQQQMNGSYYYLLDNEILLDNYL